MKSLKIFISAPYTVRDADPHEVPRLTQANVNFALSVALALIKKGHHPYCPHLSHYLHLHSPDEIGYETWMALDFAYLRCCEAILVLGDSPGCQREAEAAKRLGLIVYESLDAVPVAASGEYRAK